MTDQARLGPTIHALEQLIAVLAHDRRCPWGPHFERCLAQAQAMQAQGATQEELNQLAQSICSVYGGMGSFSDYAPVEGMDLIPGMGNLDRWSEQVFTCAQKLATSGTQTSKWHKLELKIPPLLLTILFAIAMYYSARALPVLALLVPGREIVALLCAIVGLTLALTGVRMFRKADTTVNPTTPEYTGSLVTSGIYAYSRNPMYLGMLLMLLGWALWLANALPFGFLPLFVLYMNRFQIVPEERFLAAYFVLAYPDYVTKVRRWI